jgi:hypothetical protein
MIPRSNSQGEGQNMGHFSVETCAPPGSTLSANQQLDQLVTDAVREKLLTPGRLTTVLEALMDRQSAKDVTVGNRRSALEAEISNVGEKLARLYRAIEDGVVEVDAQLRDRITALKSARELAQASLERIAEQAATSRVLTPERIAAFGTLLKEKIETADIQARKAYLQAVISEIRVADDKIQIIGDKASLAAVIAGQQVADGKVRGFVRKWRTMRNKDDNLYVVDVER